VGDLGELLGIEATFSFSASLLPHDGTVNPGAYASSSFDVLSELVVEGVTGAE